MNKSCVCCQKLFSTRPNFLRHCRTKAHLRILKQMDELEQKDKIIISTQLQIEKKDKIIIDLNEYILTLDITELPPLEDPKDKIIEDLNARIILLELQLELQNATRLEKMNEAEHIIEQTIIHANLDEDIIVKVDTICKDVVTQLMQVEVPPLMQEVPEISEITVIHAVYRNIGLAGDLEITYFAGDKMIKKPILYEDYQYDGKKEYDHSVLIVAENEVQKWYTIHGLLFMEKYNLCCRNNIQVFVRNGNPPRDYATESPYDKPYDYENFKFTESKEDTKPKEDKIEKKERKRCKIIYD